MANRTPEKCAGCTGDVFRGSTSADVIYCIECRRAGVAPANLEHGAPRRYKAGCRCDLCRDDNNRRSRESGRRARARGYARPDRPPRAEKPCDVCGKPLLRVTPDATTHTSCGTPRWWSNEIPISRGDRLAIYERDEWTCQLCAEPVDPSISSRERWGATLDHIVPRSLTLFPDDSPENLRLAHRSCNSARGNRVA